MIFLLFLTKIDIFPIHNRHTQGQLRVSYRGGGHPGISHPQQKFCPQLFDNYDIIVVKQGLMAVGL